MGQKWAEPVRKPILDVGQFAGVEPWIFWGIFSWLGWRLKRLSTTQIWRACSSVVFFLWACRLRVGYSAWVSGGECCPPLNLMNLIFARWVRMDEPYTVEWSKRVFDNFEKSDVSQQHLCFLTNEALIPIIGGRNHWWWLWNTQRG